MINRLYFLFQVILAVGVKESTRLNNIFTATNLLVVTFIIISGAIKVISVAQIINAKLITLN